jgi:hypothetical protein
MEMKDEYEKHKSRKIKAREEKKKDKEMAISSPELLVGNKRLHVFWYLAMTSVEGKGMFRSRKIPSERPLLTKDNR